MKVTDIDHADVPLVKGITRFKMKRNLLIEKIKGTTWKVTDVRFFKDLGFQIPLPNYMINLYFKKLI
jgi:hypothetical protein